MAKATVLVRVYNAQRVVSTQQLPPAPGQSVKVAVSRGDHIQLIDQSTGKGPASIKSWRVGNDLHLTVDGADGEVVISDYFTTTPSGLTGLGSDGVMHSYVLESGSPATAATLPEGQQVPAFLTTPETSSGVPVTSSGGGGNSALYVLGGVALLGAAAGGGGGGGGKSSASAPPAVPADTTPPPAPTVQVSADGKTISGSAEVGSTVRIDVLADGSVDLTATADAAGKYSVATTTPLLDGQKINVVAVDAAGNVSPVAAVTAPDITPPAMPTLQVIDDVGMVKGALASGAVTDDTRPEFRGTGTPGSVVSVFDGSILLAKATVAADGTWQATADLSLGAHSIHVNAVDAAGNRTTPGDITKITIVEQGAPGSLKLVDWTDTGVRGDSLSSDRDFSLAVHAMPAGASVTYQVSVDAGKTWVATAEKQAALADGAYSYRASVTDAAGNLTITAPISVKVDATPPGPIDFDLGNWTDTGVSQTDGLSNDNTVTFVYQTQDRVGNTFGSQMSVDGGVTWQSVPYYLPDGDIQLRATSTDVAGNVAYSPVKKITIDTQPPVPGTFSFTNYTDSGAVGDFITNVPTFGLAVAGNEPGSRTFLVTPTGNVAWNAATDGALKMHADGSYTYQLAIADAAGNIALTNILRTTIDTVPPVPGQVIISGLVGFYGGGFGQDGYTRSTSFTVAPGGGDANNYTMQRSLDGGITWQDTGTSQSSLADGRYMYRVIAQDTAGNTAIGNGMVYSSALKSLIVDTVAPTGGTISISNWVDTGVENDRVSSDNTLTLAIAGQSSDTASVVYEYSKDGGPWVWASSKPDVSDLADGTYVFRAMVKDHVDLIGYSDVTAPITIDRSPPGTPYVTFFDDQGPVTGEILYGQTDDATPTLTGRGEPGSTLVVSTGSTVLGSVQVPADGNWTFTVPQPLADSSITFWIDAIDVAGNHSGFRAAGNLIIDTRAQAHTIDVPPTVDEGSTLEAKITLTNANGNASMLLLAVDRNSQESTEDWGTPTFTNGVTLNSDGRTVNVPLGVSTFSMLLPIKMDGIIEQGDTVRIIGSAYAQSAPVTIYDNPRPLIVSFKTDSGSMFLPEDGSTQVQVTASLDRPALNAIDIPLDFEGAATLGVDYISSKTVLHFDVGQQTATFTLTGLPDSPTNLAALGGEGFEDISIGVQTGSQYFIGSALDGSVEGGVVDATPLALPQLMVSMTGIDGPSRADATASTSATYSAAHLTSDADDVIFIGINMDETVAAGATGNVGDPSHEMIRIDLQGGNDALWIHGVVQPSTYIILGEGDDAVRFDQPLQPGVRVDGRGGFDIVNFATAANVSNTLDGLSSIECIVLREGAHEINVTLDKLVAMAPEQNLRIVGEPGNVVDLGPESTGMAADTGTWVMTGAQVVADGTTFNVWHDTTRGADTTYDVWIDNTMTVI